MGSSSHTRVYPSCYHRLAVNRSIIPSFSVTLTVDLSTYLTENDLSSIVSAGRTGHRDNGPPLQIWPCEEPGTFSWLWSQLGHSCPHFLSAYFLLFYKKTFRKIVTTYEATAALLPIQRLVRHLLPKKRSKDALYKFCSNGKTAVNPSVLAWK